MNYNQRPSYAHLKHCVQQGPVPGFMIQLRGLAGLAGRVDVAVDVAGHVDVDVL